MGVYDESPYFHHKRRYPPSLQNTTCFVDLDAPTNDINSLEIIPTYPYIEDHSTLLNEESIQYNLGTSENPCIVLLASFLTPSEEKYIKQVLHDFSDIFQ